MLGKLLKHEWSATAKTFLPLYAAAAFMTLIAKITTSLDVFQRPYLNVILGISIAAYVFLLIALLAVTAVLIIIRFYKNMVTDEGYLMHTLPVTAANHIWAKTIVAACWSILSFFVFCISLFLLLITPESYQELTRILSMIGTEIAEYGFSIPLLILEGIVFMIICLVNSILFVYVSIALGQVLSHNKILGSIAAAVIINVVTQIITFMVSIPTLLRLSRLNSPDLVTFEMGFNALQSYLLLSSLSVLVFSVIYFFTTKYILKKKLNLE